MLLNIKTGYRGITKRSQQDIVYIVCAVSGIIARCRDWCFTDGHAKQRITTFYNNIDDLREVSWDIVSDRYWHNTEADFDRMRTKQAEFLVKTHVPVDCICGIVTYNNVAAIAVRNILTKLNLEIPVDVNPGNRFYY